jgi:hypothetical protein
MATTIIPPANIDDVVDDEDGDEDDMPYVDDAGTVKSLVISL